MSRPQRRFAMLGVIAAVVIALSYWASDNHVVFGPTIYVRNEMAVTADVDVMGFYGDDEDYMMVPPWKSGMCATATWIWHHHGDPASLASAKSGDWGVASAFAVASFQSGKTLYVRIDTTGALHAGEPMPEDGAGCAQYAVQEGWSWGPGDSNLP